MSIQPPRRWTPRSLTVMFLPHLFRNPRNGAEAIGPRSEKVPLDANLNHEFIKRKTERMLKTMNRTFALNTNPPQSAPKKSVWSIATGVWVPQHLLKLEYIFPFSLGPMIAREISGRIMFRDSANGMMIPPAVGLAFNEWSLVIAPHKDSRRNTTPYSYIFHMVDSEAKSLRAPVMPGSSLTVRDLDREQLRFRTNAKLNPHSCYFHSCCAMWKSTFMEDPDRRPEDFWERFQIRMDDLWGTHADREDILYIFKPPVLVKPGELLERYAKTYAKKEGAPPELVKPEETDEADAEVEDVPSSADGEAAAGKMEGQQESVEEKKTTLT